MCVCVLYNKMEQPNFLVVFLLFYINNVSKQIKIFDFRKKYPFYPLMTTKLTSKSLNSKESVKIYIKWIHFL